MRTPSPLPALNKEFRALLPTWTACAVAIGGGMLFGDSLARGTGMAAYGVGSIALGAQSIGHEYAYRTLGTILAQPSDRRRVLINKLGVLIVMLCALSAVAILVIPPGDPSARSSLWHPAAVLVAVACGLFIAPWLTMVSRSALAGTVFGISIPMLLGVAGDLLGVAKYGFSGPAAAIDAFKLTFFCWSLALLCAVGAASIWRMFMRLEAIDGRGPDIHVPVAWQRGSSTAAELPRVRGIGHPAAMLVRKEFRLQQMSFVVVGLYLVLWTSAWVLQDAIGEMPVIPVGALTVLYFAILSMLIGSLASAEERQLGTLEWQMLLPMPTWQQWAVKIAVTIGLALLFGVGLPRLLSHLDPLVRLRTPLHLWALGVTLLTACSVYVSSLSSSGVRALAVSLPVVFAGVGFIQLVGSNANWALRWLFGRGPMFRRAATWIWAREYLLVLLVAGLVVLLLSLALRNHRSAERNLRRVARQVGWIAVYVTIGTVILQTVPFLFR